MKNLNEFITETLRDVFKSLFEYRSTQTFSQNKWKDYLESIDYVKFDNGGYVRKEVPELEVCGIKFKNSTIFVDFSHDKIEVLTTDKEFKEWPNKTLAARMRDGRIYCNDENYLKSLGLTPKKNPEFNPEAYKEIMSWCDKPYGLTYVHDEKYPDY